MSRVIPILLILILAAALRLHGIGEQSLWSDEMASVALARLPIGELLDTYATWQTNPPLYELFLHGWIRLFGDSERAVRMPSALAGIAAVLMIYLLLRRLLGRREIALAAMLLLAVSPVHLEYARETRVYAISFLLALISSDLFVRLLRRPTERRHAAYVIVSALLLYAHLYGIFVLLAQHLTYWPQRLRRDRPSPLRPRAWIVDNLAVAALFAPFLPTLLRWWRTVAEHFPVDAVTPDDVTYSYWVYAGSTPTMLLLLALIVLGTVHLWRARRMARGRTALILLLALLLCPVVVPVAMAMLTRPIYLPRYGMTATLAACGLAAAGLAALPRPVALLLLAGVATMSPFGTAARIPRAPWREAGAFVSTHARAGDLAVVHNTWGRRLYEYYVDRPDVPHRAVGSGTLPVTLPLDGRRVWLVHFDEWYPLHSFVARGNLRIERRLLRPNLVVVELTDEPEPDP